MFGQKNAEKIQSKSKDNTIPEAIKSGQSSRKASKEHSLSQNAKPQQNFTRITIHYNCGYGNHFFIRGQGGGLSWDKGLPLTNKGEDLWVFELDNLNEPVTFKILINDQHYEHGNNHVTQPGYTTEYTPYF